MASSADFYVHRNQIRKRVRIHRSDCGACNHGAGMHRGKIQAGRGDTYDWIPADSYKKAAAQASVYAKRINTKKKNCGLCSPQFEVQPRPNFYNAAYSASFASSMVTIAYAIRERRSP